jgi:hypothetical protein
MALTMNVRRYREIRRGVTRRRAEVEATNWDEAPHGASVDDFLTFLDRTEPTTDDPADRSGKP